MRTNADRPQADRFAIGVTAATIVAAKVVGVAAWYVGGAVWLAAWLAQKVKKK